MIEFGALTEPVLTALWIGLPAFALLFWIKQLLVSPRGAPSRAIAARRAAVFFVASALAIALDRAFLTNPELVSRAARSGVPADAVRLVLVPFAVAASYFLAVLVQVVSPRGDDSRMSRRATGGSPLLIVLGALVAAAVLFGSSGDDPKPFTLSKTPDLPRERPPKYAPPAEGAGPADPLLAEFDRIYLSFLERIERLAGPAERDRREEQLSRGGFNFVNYRRYKPLVEEIAAEEGVPAPLLLALAVAESGFDPNYYVPGRGSGLLGVTLEAARSVGIADVRDPQGNIRAGARLLRRLLDQYGGDQDRALTAFHFGTQRVSEIGERPARDAPDVRGYLETIESVTSQLR